MEKQGLITSRRLGRTVHLFINGARFDEPVKAAVSVLKNGTTLAIGQYIKEHPGAPQRDLCDNFAITPGAANWHIKKLEEIALVTRERDGRVIKYFPGDVWDQMQVATPAVSAA
jgi:predicted transcriptional regulator